MILMNNSVVCLPRFFLIMVAVATLGIAVASFSGAASSHEVWIVYFGSHDCPVCEHVKPLLDSLVREYDIKIKAYDIARAEDYEIFSQIESVHSDGKFSVPLVIIGETILVGENQINNNLRKLTEKYRRGSGAALPYLGVAHSEKKDVGAQDSECVECRDKGRPPSIQSELRKLKIMIDRLME